MKALLLLILLSCTARADAVFQPGQFSDFEAALGGTIPYPPENLVQGLLALDQNSEIMSSILPYGRSLERTAADFEHPRTLMVWQSGSVVTPYFLYLGYTPNLEELEVIAWNGSSRQFDFKLVENYGAGKTPLVINASRPLCMACHQSGGPVFPETFWSETTENSDIESGVRAKAEDPLSPFILNLSVSPSIRVRLDNSEMAFQVDAGSSMLQIQKLCMNACGGDLECRKGLLLSALFENVERSGSSNISATWLQKMDQAMEQVWPKDGFGVLDDEIADRTVDLQSPLQFLPAEDPLRWHDVVSQLDPIEGTSSDLLAAYSKCWNFSPTQAARLKSWGDSRLDSAMSTEQMTSLVKTWLPSEAEIMSSLSEAIAAPQKTRSSLHVSWNPAVNGFKPISDPNRMRHDTSSLYTHYCSSCHGGPTNRPPVLPLSDLHQLSTYIGSADRTVKALLDPTHPIMPPMGALQPTVEERQQMLSDLK